VINFADNRVAAETGTWRLRGVVDNPEHILTPGLYVRIKLSIGAPFPAVLVAEKAIGTDQGKRFIYVVDQKSIVERRELPKEKIGRLENRLRVILGGLQPGEQVVVSGLQRIREGKQVQPEIVDMVEAAEDKLPKRQRSGSKNPDPAAKPKDAANKGAPSGPPPGQKQ
jgi:multidrug efflux pump subunit AcrA (membrane-fusion protein)